MSDLPTSPIRHFRSTGPFSKDQAKWVIFKYESLKSVQKVRKEFRAEFYHNFPRNVPGRYSFERLLSRFKENHSIKPQKPGGRTPVSKQQIDQVEKLFRLNSNSHVREASNCLGIGFGTVWKILRKILKWKPYRRHITQPLSDQNKRARLSACEFWLTQDGEWFDRVIWRE